MADRDAPVRGGPTELPRWTLPVLVVAFASIVVLAGPSLASIVVTVVAGGAVVAVVVLVLAVLRARGRRLLRAAADRPPMTDTGWQPVHDRLAEAVRALEAQGYLVAVAGRGQTGAPLVLMVDREGSVASVARSRAARSSWVTLSTCLVPDQQWLVTHRGLAPTFETHMLADVVSGRPSVEELVGRHREARAALVAHGVRLLPVRARDAAADVASRVRVVADEPVPFVQVTAEAERHRRLPEVEGWADRIDLLRRQQAALPASRP